MSALPPMMSRAVVVEDEATEGERFVLIAPQLPLGELNAELDLDVVIRLVRVDDEGNPVGAPVSGDRVRWSGGEFLDQDGGIEDAVAGSLPRAAVAGSRAVMEVSRDLE